MKCMCCCVDRSDDSSPSAGDQYRVYHSKSPEVLTSNQVIHECPHCEKEFCRSIVVSTDDSSIYLFCTACEKRYGVPNIPKQHKHLSYRKFESYRKDRLLSIDDLGMCDVLAYESSVLGIPFHHSLLCLDIFREKGFVRLIELINDDLVARIVKRELSFSTLMEDGKDFSVFRYMPLDCLPLQETIDKASEMEEPGQWPSKYDAYENNCQHFTGYCKTGKRKSEDAEKYKAIDPGHLVKNSMQTSMQVSGFSQKGSSFLSGLSSGASTSQSVTEWARESGAAGWSSDRLGDMSSAIVTGLVEKWSPVAIGWSSRKLHLN